MSLISISCDKYTILLNCLKLWKSEWTFNYHKSLKKTKQQMSIQEEVNYYIDSDYSLLLTARCPLDVVNV